MRPRDVVWQHVARVGNAARYVCNHCAAELGANPTKLQEHMLMDASNSPIELRKIMHAKLEKGWNEASLFVAAHERRDKRTISQLQTWQPY